MIATGLGLLFAGAAAAAPPTLSVTATDAVIGQTIHASAQLSESPDASGQISFEVFGPGDPTCSGPGLTPAPGSASVAGEGQYPSGEFTPPTAGVYHWNARYSDDLENPIANATCTAISTVSKANPGLTGDASAGIVNTAIHDEVSLAGAFSPTGEVTFSIYGPTDVSCSTPLETAAVPIQGVGVTSADFVPQQAGEFRWTASYAGDANNEAVSSVCGAAGQSSAVSKASPSLVATATSAVKVGLPITDNATLTGGFGAGGQLVFRAFGPSDPTCLTTPKYEDAVAVSGNGSYSPPGFAPGPGVYQWTVEYEGDANNEAVSSACGAANQASAVEKASPGLTGIASTGTVGAAIRDEITLAGAFSPTGEVTFSIYGPTDVSCSTPLETAAVPLQGVGATSPDFLPQLVGEFRWTASYPGDANNQAISLACGTAGQSSAVSKASPSLVATATSAVKVGLPITDNATLTGGFSAGGQLVFRAFGPSDPTCLTAPSYEHAVEVSGNGSYSPPGFTPAPGVYRWTVEYAGNANNEAVSSACGAANQTSIVSKALPTLVGVATSTVKVGLPIADNATLAGGFGAGGQLVFRAYGPGDPTCLTSPKYEDAVAVSGNGSYSPPGFAPGPGVYQWTVEYEGDANNEAVGSVCGAANQASAVGTIAVTLTTSATGGTVGSPISATATIQEGATPAGQITFKAFPPTDANCSGTAAFVSVVGVSGNGSYRSSAFVPSRVGTFRWTVAYSGDANHAPTTADCGKATSSVFQATPSITGEVQQRITVGTPFQDKATLQGGYAPSGTITFQIYGPAAAAGCAKPVFVDTVAVAGNGTFSSDPFVAKRTGRYSFVASYSGDAANRAATEPCGSAGQAAQVQKRTPNVNPRALLTRGRRISIRAHLSGASSPSGVINFRLYGPGDTRCRRKPAFSGSITVKSNGNYALATYLATKPGIYHLGVGYSGDPRNQQYKGSCDSAQAIRVG